MFYGDQVDEETVKGIAARIEEVAKDCDVEIIYGGQPLYYYIVSVE
jgi:dihydroxyacetone kinase-like predicted kinase